MTGAPRPGPLGRLIARLASSPAADQSSPASIGDTELSALYARLEALETMVEGLQDALYRQALHEDQRFEELTRRVEPEELARALSADVRKRGL